MSDCQILQLNFTAYKYTITEDNKKIQTKRQKPGETIKGTYRRVKQEWVNKWPNPMLAR
jgi:hypothetical protein